MDKVLIKPIGSIDELRSGLIYTNEYKEVPMYGEVVKVGDKVVGLKEGDKVLYGKLANMTVEIDNVEYTLLRESDIYTVIDLN